MRVSLAWLHWCATCSSVRWRARLGHHSRPGVWSFVITVVFGVQAYSYTSFAGPVRPKRAPARRTTGAVGGVASLFLRDLLGIMVTLMPPPPARRQEYLTNWGQRLQRLCARTEATPGRAS